MYAWKHDEPVLMRMYPCLALELDTNCQPKPSNKSLAFWKLYTVARVCNAQFFPRMSVDPRASYDWMTTADAWVTLLKTEEATSLRTSSELFSQHRHGKQPFLTTHPSLRALSSTLLRVFGYPHLWLYQKVDYNSLCLHYSFCDQTAPQQLKARVPLLTNRQPWSGLNGSRRRKINSTRSAPPVGAIGC